MAKRKIGTDAPGDDPSLLYGGAKRYTPYESRPMYNIEYDKAQAAAIDNPDFDITRLDSSGNTYLHNAAEHGRILAVQSLLRRGASVHTQDKWGKTPLFMAAEGAHTEVVQVLYEANADINAVSGDSTTALTRAIYGYYDKYTSKYGYKGGSYTKTVGYLIKNKADVNHLGHSPDDRNSTILAYVAERGDLGMAKYLLESDAELNPQRGSSPLCHAARHGHINVLKHLIENGANVNPGSDKVNIPLRGILCEYIGSHKYELIEGAKILVDNGAIINEVGDHVWGDDRLIELACKFAQHRDGTLNKGVLEFITALLRSSEQALVLGSKLEVKMVAKALAFAPLLVPKHTPTDPVAFLTDNFDDDENFDLSVMISPEGSCSKNIANRGKLVSHIITTGAIGGVKVLIDLMVSYLDGINLLPPDSDTIEVRMGKIFIKGLELDMFLGSAESATSSAAMTEEASSSSSSSEEAIATQLSGDSAAAIEDH